MAKQMHRGAQQKHERRQIRQAGRQAGGRAGRQAGRQPGSRVKASAARLSTLAVSITTKPFSSQYLQAEQTADQIRQEKVGGWGAQEGSTCGAWGKH